MVDASPTPSDNVQPLQSLLNALETQLSTHLDTSASLAPSSAPSPTETTADLESVYSQLRQALRVEKIAPNRQPYLTEFHKQMRLLGTDIGFLKASKKAETRHQRLITMGDRLQMLQRYYAAMTAVE